MYINVFEYPKRAESYNSVLLSEHLFHLLLTLSPTAIASFDWSLGWKRAATISPSEGDDDESERSITASKEATLPSSGSEALWK